MMMTATHARKTAHVAHTLAVTHETLAVIEYVTHALVVTHAAAPVVEKCGIRTCCDLFERETSSDKETWHPFLQ